jgi:3-deoxy-D-manno-octulosonic-acid transferase
VAFLYNIGIHLYHFAILVASLSNQKARLWRQGRKNIFERLQTTISGKDSLIWFHCASLGEFEQGRPLIEEIKKTHPEYKILLTFFSPSGYEVRKNYEGVDYIFYLPIDTPGNAKRFISLANPKIAVFVKYEFWFNFQCALKKNNIPLFVVSANFRSNQHFFKWYGGWFRKNLKNFTHLFVQNEHSKSLLANVGISNVTVSGDTRFDRVAAITKQVKTFPLIGKFCNGQKVFIAGSSWKPDEDILIPFIDGHQGVFKFIIAPHEVNREHIETLCNSLKSDYILYSNLNEDNAQSADVLIIDCIGILSHVYQYGYITYIGGGFGKSIHNILEPATFGMPVIFGPNHEKFAEAIELKKLQGAFSISNAAEFNVLLNDWISDPSKVSAAANVSKTFVNNNTGACEIIMKRISTFL